MKHTAEDLKLMQALPLEMKIQLTKDRIRSWVNTFGESGVYVSFSGGKDSTVLKHIVDQMYDDVPALFVNTGLEYPEIQKFAREVKAGKYECFNSDVEIIRPEMQFREVIEKYGYPIVSKEVDHKVHDTLSARRHGNYNSYSERQFNGTYISRNGKTNSFGIEKWKFLLDAPFSSSHKCCDVIKKKPAKKFEQTTGRKPIVGTMAQESKLRYQKWLQNGCNSFEGGRPTSQPLSFWTEQDVLQYIKKYDVPYCPVYGEIVVDEDADDVIDGQINVFDLLGDYSEAGKLKTTGCHRTGCIFCMFGVHLEKEPNRFQRLKETHPRQYDYCINGGEYGEDGMWRPSKTGLGMGKVLDYIDVPYE